MKMNRNLISWLFTLVLGLVVGLVISTSLVAVAQTDDQSGAGDQATANQPESGADSSNGKAPKAKDTKADPNKTFKPTEEISEDSPVPFPVDI